MKRNRVVTAASLAASLAVLVPVSASAQGLPAVKVSASNKVPECATPGRMMAMLEKRNPRLDQRFRTIATAYMRHGEQLGIRWDYAFYQMILETGSLSYQRGNGKPGDVKPTQNNFAGLGATGKGEPGEKFASVDDGVRAHLQHLLMYSGEVVENPVAERTRNVQQWGILTNWQKGFKRPITFADIAGKWAPGSRGYVSDVRSIAEQFNDEICKMADPNPGLVQEARAGRVVTAAAAKDQPSARGKGRETAPKADYVQQAMERAREEGGNQRSALGAKGVVAAAAAKPISEPAAPSVTGLKVLNETADASPSSDAPAVAATTAPEKSERTVQLASAAGAARAGAAKASAGAAASTIAALPKPPTAPAPAAQPTKCRVFTASYGGQKAVVIKAVADGFTNFTVLDVNEGQEAREVDAYISAYAKGGQNVGQFASSNTALEEAFKLCPEG